MPLSLRCRTGYPPCHRAPALRISGAKKETSRLGEVSVVVVGCHALRPLIVVPVGDKVPFPVAASAPTSPVPSLFSASMSSTASLTSTPSLAGLCGGGCRGQCKTRNPDNTNDLGPDRTNSINHDQGYGRTGRDYPAPQASCQGVQGLQTLKPSGDCFLHLIASPSVAHTGSSAEYSVFHSPGS